MNNIPSGAKILSLLVELLADQHDVKVKYEITTEEKEGAKDGR